jgi:uncharacterized protein (DUF1501 family)
MKDDLTSLEETLWFFANSQPYSAYVPVELNEFASQFGLDLRRACNVPAAADNFVATRFEKSISLLGRKLQTLHGPTLAVVEFFGWDTHHNQGSGTGRIARLLKCLDQGIGTLASSCAGLWDRTAIVIVSEFGRSVMTNQDGGTEHGIGAAALVVGGAVRGGRIVGDWPGLATPQLVYGNSVRPTIDFRSVLASILAAQFKLTEKQLAEIFPDSLPPIEGLLEI